MLKATLRASLLASVCLLFANGASAQTCPLTLDFDTDGSGGIDSTELKAAMQSLGFADTTSAHVKEMMEGVDKDANGTIDFDEVSEAAVSSPG